jgi:hypothetical protein
VCEAGNPFTPETRIGQQDATPGHLLMVYH